jgi:hypothetical protein
MRVSNCERARTSLAQAAPPLQDRPKAETAAAKLPSVSDGAVYIPAEAAATPCGYRAQSPNTSTALLCFQE